MAKGPNQKLKLLYLKDILETHSDEGHPLSMKEILHLLSLQGVLAERKSIYDDIETLRSYGVDIVLQNGKNGGYYVGSSSFELPELKLLVDAVQASKFITHKKSAQLIKKIEGLTNIHNARLLQRQVYVANRTKTLNEQIYYNVDTLHEAISKRVQIQFQYFEWQINLSSGKPVKRTPRKNGDYYTVSPWALSWDDENYYLISYDAHTDMIRHYRVDKMQHISLLDAPRAGSEHFEQFDMAIYSKKMFGMFGGVEQTVTLQFANRLIGVVIDRFGDKLSLQKGETDDTFRLTLNIVVSDQFFSWLAGFRQDAKIISPSQVKEDYTAFLKSCLTK